MDCFDLANCVRTQSANRGTFYARSRREMREKTAELERSGELVRRIEEMAANALPEEPAENALLE